MSKSQDFVEKVLNAYPAKVMKNRKKHISVREGDDTHIAANTRTVPGIITNRGCCYAGCKGVVVGPIVDMVHITHGPIGCAYYSWGTRRNKGKAREDGQNYLAYSFSTDMQETDIVFGGEKKLIAAIDDAVKIFNPKAISIHATCPVGLIGDDINMVAQQAQEKHGIPILAFSCEGYKGVSQSAGHHIANNKLMTDIVGSKDLEEVPKYSINLLGEYNIGGDEWEIARVLHKIGYNVITTMTGNCSIDELSTAHKSDINLVQCHRSINYIAEMIEEKYGLPWLKVNFIGVAAMTKSLRDLAKYFGDEDLIKRTEEVIAEELAEIEDDIKRVKEKLEGKTAVLFVGGSRAHHYQGLLKEIGLDTIVAGYEFGHRDDYEGRDIIPDIKVDADSRNIEEIKVERDEENFSLRLSKEKYDELKKEISMGNYSGMVKDMKDGTIMIDDLNHFETEMIVKYLKPDFFGSGIKDKFIIQKMGVFSKQMHSYDYGGPYAGYRGAVTFAKDCEAGILTPAWSYIIPPWKKEPILTGKLVEKGDEEAC